MVRRLIPFVLFLIVVSSFPSCSGGGGGGGFVSGDGSGGGEESFPDLFEESFTRLQSNRWDLVLDEEVAAPFAENGRLRFRWSDARSSSEARLVLKKRGFYQSAALEVASLESGVEAEISIELISEAGPLRAAIYLDGAAGDRSVEALIEDPDGKKVERERERFSSLDVPAGSQESLIRFEVDRSTETIRFYAADDILLEVQEPGLRVPTSSALSIAVRGGDPAQTAIERFQAARIGAVQERSLTDVRANHAIPSRVQWLFKLRDARGDVVRLAPSEAELLEATVYEEGDALDTSETCPTIRTLDALPLQIAIVLDHTLSMETFGGLEPMKESAKALLDSLEDSHQFTIWEFHDNDLVTGFSKLLGAGESRERGKEVIDEFVPPVRGFSLNWDTLTAAIEEDFPDDSPAAPLRAIFFFSDGVDTSSRSEPRDVIDDALDRGILLFDLGYGRLTDSSRTALIDMAKSTGGVFAEAETPEQLRPRFQKLIDELSGFLQLAYVTGRIQDSRIEALASFTLDGERVQRYLRDRVNGESISFDDDDLQYDTQAGLLTIDGPEVSGEDSETVTLEYGAVHVPRLVERFDLRVLGFEIDGETPLPLEDLLSVSVLANGPFEDWQETGSLLQLFQFEGIEACFGDFGPLIRLTVDATDLPASFVLELTVDNTVFAGLASFSGGDETELDESGNWVRRFRVDR
ncbi:MAG: vWA domain-containing protein [Planctomycetota bacterium]